MHFRDVRFKVHCNVFESHKLILVAWSDLLAAMLKIDIKKSSTETDIEDIEPDVFHQLLHFLYPGQQTAVTVEAKDAGLLFATGK